MRKINFSAGPTGLPLEVLERAKAEFTDYRGEGYSIMEISHRSKTYEEVHFGAMEKIRKLYGFGDEYEVLFLQGGAHLQFAMIPISREAARANTQIRAFGRIRRSKRRG